MTPAAAERATTPSYASIEGWGELTGMSRSGTYRALNAGQLRAKRMGGRTFVDVKHGLAWIAGLPDYNCGDKT